jgi:signal transduction histidine kinase
VTNDGPAIDPEDLPRLLERFTRARPRSGPGFGLGLAIADAIARGHGGTLELQARAPGGLIATARLPSFTSAQHLATDPLALTAAMAAADSPHRREESTS